MNTIEHIYEIFFFFTLFTPLIYVLTPKVMGILRSKVVAKRENKKNLIELGRTFEEKRNQIKEQLRAEVVRQSKLPNYLNEFEKEIAEEIEADNNKILHAFEMKIANQNKKKINESKREAIKLFMENFRESFADSVNKRVSIEHVLRAIEKDVNREKKTDG